MRRRFLGFLNGFVMLIMVALLLAHFTSPPAATRYGLPGPAA